MALYRGFSSHQYKTAKTFAMTDIELVNMDLLNHIYTPRGARVMMPQFGTRIPLMAFEPLDDITIGIVDNDLRYVFNFDPRVQLISMSLVPQYDDNMLQVSALLRYIELNMTETLNLNILFEDSQ